MLTTTFNHIHIICENLETMISFFINILGGKLVDRKPYGGSCGAKIKLGEGIVCLRLPKDTGSMELKECHDHYGYDHIGLNVTDVDKAYETLKKAGYLFESPPVDTVTYRIVFFRGPEGIKIELMQTKYQQTC